MIRFVKENPSRFIVAHSLELVWSTCQDCYIVYDDETPVALLDISSQRIDDLFIVAFESFQKGTGIGGRVIEHLKTKATRIWLYPNSECSMRFWEQHGFQVVDDDCGTPCMEYLS